MSAVSTTAVERLRPILARESATRLALKRARAERFISSMRARRSSRRHSSLAMPCSWYAHPRKQSAGPGRRYTGGA
jgi:hypothetical protein